MCADLYFLMHNAPALLVLQSKITTPAQQLFLHYATRRRAPVKNHNGVTLCAPLLLYLLFASRGKRDCLFAYQEQNQRPLISILISSATPRDLILSCGVRFARSKKNVYT
jgi:hypothetical protein